MIARTLIATMCALVGFTSAAGQGATASLDIAILEQAKDVYWAKIMTLINGLQIPDIVSSDGQQYLKDQHLYISQASQNVVLQAIPENNEIKLSVSGLTGIYQCNSFRAVEWIFVALGHIEVDLNDINISVGLKFSSQTLSDGAIMPAIEAVDVVVDIDRNDLKIKISGNIWSDLVSIFTPFFKGPVVDLIRDTATKALETGIPAFLNTALASTGGMSVIPGFPNWFIDYQTPDAAVVTATSFEAGIRGIMFDSDIGESEWTANAPADLPYKTDAHTAGLQAFISDWSINSVVGSFLEVYDVQGWVNATSEINGTALNLNAGSVALIFPQIQKTYGADTPLNILISLSEAGDFTTSQALQQIHAQASLDVQFWVETANGDELALDVSFNGISLNATFTITNFLLGLEVNYFKVDSIDVVKSNVGRVSTLTLLVEINTGFKILVPIINSILTKFEVTLPSDILGLFTLSDLNLEYYDGYTYFGATPTFIAPTHSQLFVQ